MCLRRVPGGKSILRISTRISQTLERQRPRPLHNPRAVFAVSADSQFDLQPVLDHRAPIWFPALTGIRGTWNRTRPAKVRSGYTHRFIRIRVDTPDRPDELASEGG